MAYRKLLETYFWNPNILITKDSSLLCEQNFALIVLNHGLDNLDQEINLFHRLWKSAKFRLAVDGGANNLTILGSYYVPDCISGDFDSITESVYNHFKKLGVEMIETPDVNHTDLFKALLLLRDKTNTNNLHFDHLVIVWQPNHRLDQTFGIISCLYKWHRMEKNCPIFLLDIKGSFSWLCPTGKHQIMSNNSSKWCSLVPFDGLSRVTSTGLTYNMDDFILSMDKVISTSNSFDKSTDKVTLKIEEKPVTWSQHFDLTTYL